MDNTVGGFLQSRRARIQPEDVGLPPYGRRRVPGLRREEVAQLAGVSVDYYIRLEQGRGRHVSDEVLDAVARVLRLDPAEHEHLRDLARPGRAPRSGSRAPAASPRVRPGVRLMLDGMRDVPAFVLGRRMDVLAWNDLCGALQDFRPGTVPNMVRAVFQSPDARSLYPDWPAVAAETVAYLRLDAGKHPDDPELAALVGELSVRSEDFRRLWADHLVKEKTFGVKRIDHPVAGELELAYETLALPGDPDQTVVVYSSAGSRTAERLALLASWTAGPPAVTTPATHPAAPDGSRPAPSA
ncbi:helix-turn-helix transcriptional regulator [Actinacidiphila acidipaludis]|uniref:Helix-turn-helix transcriptional regulator n=1 Tax=Actinacidiphila acidipaludis TaxID=2873382 RepID=A0ABS7Q2H1_9ACTN|nr:helix-turn-helix transcriptional regulator [Streptomyces acidipaludis]MBY8877330.1 helix-turn-helix transcriptional regulator [Streptomyces acidipaludis]